MKRLLTLTTLLLVVMLCAPAAEIGAQEREGGDVEPVLVFPHGHDEDLVSGHGGGLTKAASSLRMVGRVLLGCGQSMTTGLPSGCQNLTYVLKPCSVQLFR
ncbi:MAG: hypothetical protein M5R40_20210 [Anaerolineae bacterium]|nr:hypothetical protein [Anaerolineae bacterium]